MSERTLLSRLSTWAAPVLILLALNVGTFAGVVRYTPLLDPLVGMGGAMATDAFHHDPKPCLRYPKPPLRSSIETASRGLFEAGLTSGDLSELVGALYARANAREAALHAQSEADEHLEAFRRSSGPLSRLVIALKRDRLRDQLTSILTVRPTVTRTVASLPEKQREAENDVVSTLNGFPLASPDKALEAYAALRNATRVEVAVIRDGRPLTLVVRLR